MKDYFTIKEMAELYGVGIDALRNYEAKGLLQPKRGANNYRLYSLHDVSRLTIIRDLRDLSFSIPQIKAYLDNFTSDNTLSLLERENTAIQKQIQVLHDTSTSLRKRIERIQMYRQVTTNSFNYKQMPERYCFELESHITSDAAADLRIKQLHRKHKKSLSSLGDLEIAALPALDTLGSIQADIFHSVFFMSTVPASDADFKLEAGTYLSCFYRGPYSQSSEQFAKLLDYAHKKGYTLEGTAFEIYHIDNRYTANAAEFVTEIQVSINY